MRQVTLKSSFEEILGKDVNEFTEEQRKKRWHEWQKIALKQDDGKDFVESWTNCADCEGCLHLAKSESWCTLMSLPCTVNPILSFRMGVVGLACMGIGRETTKQLELFEE